MVYLPLWKIWVRQLGWWFPIYGKIIQMFQTTNQLLLPGVVQSPCYALVRLGGAMASGLRGEYQPILPAAPWSYSIALALCEETWNTKSQQSLSRLLLILNSSFKDFLHSSTWAFPNLLTKTYGCFLNWWYPSPDGCFMLFQYEMV